MADLQRVLWQTILEVEGLLHEDECPPERVLRCAHALSQLAGAFKAVFEVASLEARIAALEHATQRNGH